MYRNVLLSLVCLMGLVVCQERKWEFLQPRPIAQVTANPGAENAFPAWYHMPPKQQHSPAYGGFERQPTSNQGDPSYRGYPSFSRQPPTQAVANPYEAAPRRPFPQPDPNAELFNAIRDVVNKFKASLDESGLDQDVRQMGRQLQNTWQQLRAGPGSVNEQLSQMFTRSQSQDAPKH